MIERQIRYNFRTETAEQEEFTRHKWIFLIINKPEEIRRIRERIYGGTQQPTPKPQTFMPPTFQQPSYPQQFQQPLTPSEEGYLPSSLEGKKTRSIEE